MEIWLSVGPFAWCSVHEGLCSITIAVGGKNFVKKNLLENNRQKQQEHFSRCLQREGREKERVRDSRIRKKVWNSSGGRTLHRIEHCCYYCGLFAPCHRQDGSRRHPKPPCTLPALTSVKTLPSISASETFTSESNSSPSHPLMPTQQESIFVPTAHCSLV